MKMNTDSFLAKACLKKRLLDGEATVKTDQPCTISEVRVDLFYHRLFFLLIDLLSNISFNWKNILKEVNLWKSDGKQLAVSGRDIKWSLLPSGYPTCQSIDLTESFDLKMKTPLLIAFRFFPSENLGVSLQIEDRRMSLLKRRLRSQRHDYVGSAIEIESLSSGLYKRFHLRITQTINLEIDSGIKCRNYPNKEFLSYRECDENFVYKKMKAYKALPFWAAKTFEEVTNRT